MNSLFDILSLKVNSDYLWAKGPSERKSCRVGINCVDFRCALEESPFNTADLYVKKVSTCHQQMEGKKKPLDRLRLTPIGPKPQIPTMSPFWTPVSTTA